MSRDFPYRRQVRRPNWDYTSPGAYFVTMCTKNRRPFFGTLSKSGVALSPIGQFATEVWVRTQDIVPNVQTLAEECIVMPDHIHAIAWILDESDLSIRDPAILHRRGMRIMEEIRYGLREKKGQKRSLSSMVDTFKSIVSRCFHQDPMYRSTELWQRGFYDSIIDSARYLENVRRYIRNNPFADKMRNE